MTPDAPATSGGNPNQGTPAVARTPIITVPDAGATPSVAMRSAALFQRATDLSTANTVPEVDLGKADGFNAFVLGNYSGIGGTIDGCLAVAGSATIANGTVAAENSECVDGLVAGASLASSHGQVQYGNVVYGGSLAGGPSVPNGTITNGPTTYFDNARGYFTSLSSGLADQTPNGTFRRLSSGAISFVGTDALTNVFDVSAADLNRARRADDRRAVRIDGDRQCVWWQRHVRQLRDGPEGRGCGTHHLQPPGRDDHHVDRCYFEGTIVAPHATYIQTGGEQHGQVIVDNLTSTDTRFFNLPFAG